VKGLLAQIVGNKREELAEACLKRPLKEIRARLRYIGPSRNFIESVTSTKDRPVRLIAEIKKRSPVKGLLREDLRVDDLARRYEEAGASAISVITEEKYFSGDPVYISMAKKAAKIPVLRKDFLLEEYHLYESRFLGADAVLLITAILDQSALSDFIRLSSELGMVSLVEIHDEWELERALKAEAEVIGINNRDLSTFKVDINTTFRILKEIPSGKIIVSESGIENRYDVQRLGDAGVNAVLVGESIVTSKDIEAKIKELIG
jgi:indole-3-glycerol phosphate synthase